MKKESSLKVINSVLKYELKSGHLKWKLTDIARISGVHRSLIYYHFGKTKKEIFNRSLEIIMSEFYGTSAERMKYIENGDLYGCVLQNFRMFRDSPEFIAFYNKTRFKKSPVQDKLIEIEKVYQKKLHQLFPHLSSDEIGALHGVIQGVVSSPVLNLVTFEIAMKSIVGSFLSRPHRRHY